MVCVRERLALPDGLLAYTVAVRVADLLRSATRTERDECFDMLEQVETGRPL